MSMYFILINSMSNILIQHMYHTIVSNGSYKNTRCTIFKQQKEIENHPIKWFYSMNESRKKIKSRKTNAKVRNKITMLME